jgi:hypothetical protein
MMGMIPKHGLDVLADRHTSTVDCNGAVWRVSQNGNPIAGPFASPSLAWRWLDDRVARRRFFASHDIDVTYK